MVGRWFTAPNRRVVGSPDTSEVIIDGSHLLRSRAVVPGDAPALTVRDLDPDRSPPCDRSDGGRSAQYGPPELSECGPGVRRPGSALRRGDATAICRQEGAEKWVATPTS